MTTVTKPVRVQIKDGIALITINNPPVNAASQPVRAGLLEAILDVQGDGNVAAAVIVAEGRTFVAGGDIREFGKPPLAPALPDVCNDIEASSKPIVVALHGTALGGGLEIALACHARVLATDARVGLPEVKLGLLPGAGGSQRLPRLIGMLPALDMITTGKQVRANEALRLGIADRISGGDLRDAAVSLARELVGRPVRRTGTLAVPTFDEDAAEAALEEITKKARGQISPIRAAEVVMRAAKLPLIEGLALERATFVELMKSSQSRALRHSFFAEREVMRVPGLDDIAPRSLTRIGLIGAGTMGAGIAVGLSDAGLPVTVGETSVSAVEAGRARIGSDLHEDAEVRAHNERGADCAPAADHVDG